MLVVGVLGYAAYYTSAGAREGRREDDAFQDFLHSDAVVLKQYEAGLGLDSAIASDIPVRDSTAIAGCTHLFQLETQGDAMDQSQATREIRLRSEARKRQSDANAIVMTTPASWPGRVRGEVYRCPK